MNGASPPVVQGAVGLVVSDPSSASQDHFSTLDDLPFLAHSRPRWYRATPRELRAASCPLEHKLVEWRMPQATGLIWLRAEVCNSHQDKLIELRADRNQRLQALNQRRQEAKEKTPEKASDTSPWAWDSGRAQILSHRAPRAGDAPPRGRDPRPGRPAGGYGGLSQSPGTARRAARRARQVAAHQGRLALSSLEGAHISRFGA